MKIVTSYDPKPIPLRQFDWIALDEDTYDGAEDSGTRGQVGYGKTEKEAISDLLEQLDLEACERCGGSGEIAISIYFPCSYVGPGPVPDDARHVTGSKCDCCDGSGFTKEEQP